MSPEDLNNRLIPHLKEIIPKKVTYNENEAKTNMEIMMNILDTMIKAMKEGDPLFKLLYQRRVYTGSYYDGLRITEANEFDLNLVLRLPFLPEDVEVIKSSVPAFVKYHLTLELEEILGKNPKWTGRQYQRLKPMFEDRYLRRDKLHSWFQGVVTKACAGMDVTLRQSGPAITLTIAVSKTKKLDVDVVPVVDCSMYPIPGDFTKSSRFRQLKSEEKVWFMVPKPIKNEVLPGLYSRTCWRISFPEAEKKLLEGMHCVKPLIKLFKLLRDIEQWPIDSYIIKGLFLLKVNTHPKKAHWHERHMGTRFMEMLEEFKSAVECQTVEYFFHRDANLLSQLPEPTAKNIVNRLGKIITQIEAQPSSVLDVYKVAHVGRRLR